MARDLSDIALNTLMVYLSTETGIPTGSFMFQYPNNDFINERTFQKFPSVGIIESEMLGGTRFEYVNYGCTYIGDQNDDDSYVTYFPLGRKTMMFQIDLWAETQAQRRKYRSLIEIALLKKKFLLTSQFDSVPNEAIDIELLEYYQNTDKPFCVSFLVKVVGSVFKEENTYPVNTIQLSGTVAQNYTVDGSTTGSIWIVITSGALQVTGDPSNG